MAKAPQKITLSPSRDIPFDRLVLSQANVRRIKAGVSIGELAEDIARRTLLESLSVRPQVDETGEETGRFEVPAGGRRFRALELLVKQKRLSSTAPVPCIVRSNDSGVSAEEDSYAENIYREALHPLDQFRAMQLQVDEGQDIEAIAARFMTTPAVVRQRLKLATVSPKLHEIYAEDGMTLEQLMAFSVSDKSNPELDAWIRIAPDGTTTVFSGKAELGQGIRTALLQVIAEELDLPPHSITFITADTARTPDEGLTAGSHSMQDGGTALANAGANVRMLLTSAAAKKWGVPPERLTTSGDGHIVAPDGRRLAYGLLAASLSLHVEAVPDAPRRDPRQYRTMGRNLPRVDIPAKLTGGEAFVQDLRLPGMLHARVVRGPSYGTRLAAPKLHAARTMPGVVAVIENGDFIAVVARKEWQAIKAMRVAQQSDYVRTLPPLPADDGPHRLQKLAAQEITVLDTHDGDRPVWKTVRGSFSRPWYSHGSIGPSCAVALARDGELTLWSHSQGVFDMHRAVAELVGLPPEKVRCIHTPSAGCYGQNGADDVTAEAGLIAMALPGHPIRLQWMREQEFGWEPCGCGMVTRVEASIGPDRKIARWIYEVWSNSHNNRPVTAGGYAVAQQVSPGFAPQPPKPIPMPEGDGDRNANPLYVFPNMDVRYHFVPEMPLRVSALRSLGAHLNVFTIESVLDELALAGGGDPLDFRLAHMKDERARAVMIEATRRFDWVHRPKGDGRRGCGMAFARYKNIGAYCALAMEIEVERETGAITVHRVNAAVDAGQPATPDGIRNQVEGGIVQSLSWATREAVSLDPTRRTSFDWGTYPILRFRDVPGSIDVHVMDRSGLPFLGAGETAQGPASAALANALADATGVRLRDMPLTPEAVKAAIGIAG